MPDIFDEVEEDLRAERARRVLRRYGGLMIAAAVLIVAGVAGYEAWTSISARRAGQVADAYMDAAHVADGPPGTARQAALPQLADIARDGPEGYRTLARLRAAALRADAGDLPGATAIWDEVAGDSGADRLLRDLATLTWARRSVDSGDPAAIAARLRPLTAPDNSWRALAQETLALLAIRQGDIASARNTLQQLRQDTTAPDGVRGRANGLLDRLGA